MFKRIKGYYKRNNGLKGTLIAIGNLIKNFGFINVIKRVFGKHVGYYSDYQHWIKNIEKKYTPQSVAEQLSGFHKNPKISVLIPVYNVDEVYLRACVDSVINQYYENWELCLADDCSPKPHVKEILEEYMAQDSRIKVVFRTQNGHISEATNSALAVATGEYIALLDNDDVLKTEALLEIVQVINDHDQVDMVYSDEDKINESGEERVGPSFKPDWSPDAFLSHMYLCHLGVYRTSIAREIGGFRTAYNGSQDYDFALRFSEQTKYIYHAPYILYHWRMIPTSTAMNTDSKDYAFEASVKAKEDTAKRRAYDTTIIPVEEEFATNFVYNIDEQNDFVSIIMHQENPEKTLTKTINSIINNSNFTQYEIIILSNEDLQIEQEKVKVMPFDVNKNVAQRLNNAAKHAKGNYYLFLDDNMEVTDPSWLRTLLGQAKQQHTGAVGAKLIDQQQLIQQAGIVIVNYGHKPVYAFSRYGKNSVTYLGRVNLNYNYTAIGLELLMVSKEKFDLVAGFTEEYATEHYLDIDFGIKLLDKGYFNVCRGDVEVFCYSPRKYDELSDTINELEYDRLYRTWGEQYLNADHYYNINLSQSNASFAINQENRKGEK